MVWFSSENSRKVNLTYQITSDILDIWKVSFPLLNQRIHKLCRPQEKGGVMKMTVKQKKLFMIIVGFLVYAAAGIIKGLRIIDSRFLFLCLILIQYGGMIAFIFGINYFGTTYQYEKYPEESAQTVIDQNDERTRAIHTLAKAKAFNIITYVLILLPALLFEMKADLTGIAASGTALIVLGISYLYFYLKYSKEM